MDSWGRFGDIGGDISGDIYLDICVDISGDIYLDISGDISVDISPRPAARGCFPSLCPLGMAVDSVGSIP